MSKLRLPEICLILTLAGAAPLLVFQMAQLWERPHFQFFPLTWIAFIWFAIKEAGSIETTSSLWRKRLGIFSWGLGSVTSLYALALYSPWTANLATVLSIYGWGLLRLGNLSVWRWTACHSLLLIALPLPGNRDAMLVGTLQWLSSISASSILDLFGILHIRQGNVLEIRSSKLFVDEACSGVDSLYALGAVALSIMLFQKRPLVVGLFALMTVPVWSWLGNVIRLVVITVVLDKFSIDLSTGWKHTALGMVTFALMVGFYFATVSGLARLFRRFGSKSLPEGSQTWHLLYNRVVSFPGLPPTTVKEADLYFDERTTAKKDKPRVQRPLDARLKGAMYAAVIGLGCFCLAANILLLIRNRDYANSLALPSFTQGEIDQAITADSLPEVLLDAKRTDFKSTHRNHDMLNGEHSRTWSYVDQNGSMLLSIDFPFRGFHPLWVCYTNVGNTLIKRSAQQFEFKKDEKTYRFELNRVELRDELTNSYVLFVNVDRDGNIVSNDAEESVREIIRNRIFRPSPANLKLPPVTYQFQLHASESSPISEANKSRYEAIFVEALPYVFEALEKFDTTD